MMILIESDSSSLSHLVHKHPDKYQTFNVGVGTAKVFFPTYGPDEYSMCLLAEVNQIESVRKGGAITDYINDRQYTSGSILSTAINKTLKSAMNGVCTVEDAEKPHNYKVHIPCIKIFGKSEEKRLDFIESIFIPLGYSVTAKPYEKEYEGEFESDLFYSLTLEANTTLSSILNQIYILLHVIDPQRHYHPKKEDVEKLVRRGSWLSEHPSKEVILSRFLGRDKLLIGYAKEIVPGLVIPEEEGEESEEKTEKVYLHDMRHDYIVKELKKRSCQIVADIGCSTGKLIERLIEDQSFTKIYGVDPSIRNLERASRWCKASQNRDRLDLLQGSATYYDRRIKEVDAVILTEVIEHVDIDRLPSLEHAMFGMLSPKTILVTTPNREFNVLFEDMETTLRHPDHKFEFDRNEFEEWVKSVAESYDYEYELGGIGEVSEVHGTPSQAVIFTKK